MYQWVFVVGTFTATLSAARSWMMISIVSGATHMSSLLDIYAANAGAQTPRLSKRTAETHTLARSQHSPFMGGAGLGRQKRKWESGTEKLMKQRYVKARFHSIMAPEGQQRVDEATALAAVGRLRAGGTAIGTSSPPESQIARALRKFQVERRAS